MQEPLYLVSVSILMSRKEIFRFRQVEPKLDLTNVLSDGMFLEILRHRAPLPIVLISSIRSHIYIFI